jgi:AmmeMemoRadiSam system protein B
MIRRPAVAGQFYPASKAHLEEEVKKYLSTGLRPEPAVGVISPHAGYVYSGHVAGAVFSAVKVPQRVIVLSPNHTGLGAPAAIMNDGEWALPTGNIRIDSGLASDLIKECGELQVDHRAHLMEHSLEVQLPFLQARQPDLRMVPICLSHIRYDICEKIGRAIASVIWRIQTPPFEKGGAGGALIVASSDMTHYEPHEAAKKKDSLAIDRIMALDAKGLLDICARERITMCGVVPVAVMLIAAKELGAKEASLLKYATSGDVSGDYDAVVGYAGMLVC